MSRQQPTEGVPLLPAGQSRVTHRSSTRAVGRNTLVQVEKETELWDENQDDEILFADRKRRGTSLILNDTVFMVLYFLQMLAVLQSLALRWTWPSGWLKTTKFIFLFNVDVWEFMKLNEDDVFVDVQGYFTPSDSVGVDYWLILLGWAVFLFLALLAYIITYAVITYMKHPYMFVQLARLKRAYVIIAQLVAIPLGITLARLFHCDDDNKVEVHNDLKCYHSTHWAYLVPALIVVILFYICFPLWLIMKTKAEMLSMTPERHEGYLQLKEIEYVHGLDLLWAVGGFHIFSSFTKRGCHYRAVIHITTAVIMVFYAALAHHLFAQALLINMILFCVGLAFLVIRPFRVSCFNVMLFITFLCLNLDSMMGSLVANFNPNSVRSIWLTPSYLNPVLYTINIFWLICVVFFIVYLILRRYGCWCCCCTDPLWPSLESKGLSRLQAQTRKFVKAILRGRVLIERVISMPAIFAPAHELARHIHIINAYCREAECLRDPMQESLWDLLDELIETHTQIAPKSLFAESVKDSIRLTASEFMKIMPMFVRRLAQREYDFILMTPVKRRLLLKMYCMGLFLNGRRESIQRERLTLPALQRVWGHKHTDVEEYHDDGYYEDMYPEAEEGPAYRPTTTLTLDMHVITEEDIDDELALEEAEQWTKDHPLNRQTYLNMAFVNEQDNVSEILRDDVSVDLSQMMEGVPSRPATAQSRPSTARSADLLALPALPSGHNSRPSSAGSRPATPGSRPGTAGSRPSSAGSRPGSSNTARESSFERSAQGTPLPGQVDDTTGGATNKDNKMTDPANNSESQA